MHRGAWKAMIHGVAKSQTRLKQLNNNKSLCVFLLEVLFLFLKGRMECRTTYEA